MQEREPALCGLERKRSKIQWTIRDVFTATAVVTAVQIMRAMQTVETTRNAVAHDQIQSPYKDLEFLRTG